MTDYRMLLRKLYSGACRCRISSGSNMLRKRGIQIEELTNPLVHRRLCIRQVKHLGKLTYMTHR